MKISIHIDVDPLASGYINENELKDNIIYFAKDLIINGAENEDFQITLLSVDYY